MPLLQQGGICLCLSSVHPSSDPKSRTERCSELKIGMKEVHDRSDPLPHLEVERSNVYQGSGIFVPHSLYVLQGRQCPLMIAV